MEEAFQVSILPLSYVCAEQMQKIHIVLGNIFTLNVHLIKVRLQSSETSNAAGAGSSLTVTL